MREQSSPPRPAGRVFTQRGARQLGQPPRTRTAWLQGRSLWDCEGLQAGRAEAGRAAGLWSSTQPVAGTV